MPQYRSIYEPHPVETVVTDPASTIIAASIDSTTRERINTAVKSVRDVARECWSDLDVYGPYAKSGGYRAFKLSHDSWEAVIEQTDIGDETIDIDGEEWLLRQRVWILLMEQFTTVVFRDGSVDISVVESKSNDEIRGPQRFIVRSRSR